MHLSNILVLFTTTGQILINLNKNMHDLQRIFPNGLNDLLTFAAVSELSQNFLFVDASIKLSTRENNCLNSKYVTTWQLLPGNRQFSSSLLCFTNVLTFTALNFYVTMSLLYLQRVQSSFTEATMHRHVSTVALNGQTKQWLFRKICSQRRISCMSERDQGDQILLGNTSLFVKSHTESTLIPCFFINKTSKPLLFTGTVYVL